MCVKINTTIQSVRHRALWAAMREQAMIMRSHIHPEVFDGTSENFNKRMYWAASALRNAIGYNRLARI